MSDKFKIVIVGAGPGGLSAATRASELGISHVLLEASPHVANTVHRYQKRKLVMAEPMKLPLRSSLSFAAGTRESVLETWQQAVADHRINLRTNAVVSSISGHRDDFRITLDSGEVLEAAHVVLAIGLQGNIRKLGVPGEDLYGVQYQLDDPEEYADETILVIGGGDAGVENALALATRNRVILINRQDEFTNCREANFSLLREAVTAGRLETRVGTSPVRVEVHQENDFLLSLVAQSPQGVERINCHRVVARLGATPPRQMLERFGIHFPNNDPTSVPQLSEQYESNIPGLYIVGALAGCPLIKQALNQGYEVIEYILGNPIEPADQAFLVEKFSRIPGVTSVADGIDLVRGSLPLLASLSTLQLREFMLDSDVLVPQPGEVIFKQNDYSNSFFSVLHGTVKIHVEKDDGDTAIFSLPNGDFFGEIGLLSGRRRSGTAVASKDCVVIETSRRSMLRLLDVAPSVQRRLDEVSLKRIVHNCYGASLPESQLDHLVHLAELQRYGVGETIFNEGDAADALYMIRRGSVTVSRQVAGKELVLAYVSAGNYVGEMALVSKMPRTATVRAAAPTEVVVLGAARFNAVMDQSEAMRSEVAGRYLERIRANESAVVANNSELIQFLMDQGVGEATDILLIDNAKCIRCNYCEKACADVHDGSSRLSREAGHSNQQIHVPASCRHCEHPRCMKNCPPDAIHRSPHGEVFISESCIGCGNCQSNCPYGVIQMASIAGPPQPSILQLIFGRGKASPRQHGQHEDAQKKAVKCDMCRDIIGGAACVRVCPTGAAFRVSPEQFLTMSGG
jgi:CRP-like cAMP-binding protein/thioredoxin reductase/ferredoxin-like protein FixX